MRTGREREERQRVAVGHALAREPLGPELHVVVAPDVGVVVELVEVHHDAGLGRDDDAVDGEWLEQGTGGHEESVQAERLADALEEERQAGQVIAV